jgi:hypothetical protein
MSKVIGVPQFVPQHAGAALGRDDFALSGAAFLGDYQPAIPGQVDCIGLLPRGPGGPAARMLLFERRRSIDDELRQLHLPSGAGQAAAKRRRQRLPGRVDFGSKRRANAIAAGQSTGWRAPAISRISRRYNRYQ